MRRQNIEQYIEVVNLLHVWMWMVSLGEACVSFSKQIWSYCMRDIRTPLGGEEIHSSSVCCAFESNKRTEKESFISKYYKKIKHISTV